MSRVRYDVCTAVVSDLAFDARVWKEVRSLAAAGYQVRLLGCYYGAKRAPTRRDGDVEIFEVSLGSRSGDVSIPARARALFRLWAEVLRTPASIYHAHNIHVGPAAWLSSRFRGAKLVYDAHELYGEAEEGAGIAERIAAAVGWRLERFLVRRSDGVITTNASRADQLRGRHGDVRIEVLANVPRIVEEISPLDPGYPDGSAVLLYQGGIYAEGRAFSATIQALTMLENVHFVIIGFGRERDLERVRRWADEAGVSDRVHLLPPRSFEELVHTAAAATIGLVPIIGHKTNHYLGDTNKLFEYLMGGLPVAASDLPEIRRVVASGEPAIGELFDPASPASIASAVSRLLADPDVYEQRCKEARRLALQRYNWNVEESRLLALYAGLRPQFAGIAAAVEHPE